MSRTPDQVRGRLLSTNSGSVDSLKVSLRCGWRENARQMRCTVEIDKPEALAIERVLQWVAAAGIVSNVVVTTSAIFSSPILRGAPGRGSSARPSSRLAANRLRQVATVTRVTPSRSAIARLVAPSAASSTIAARIASARDIFRRRVRAARLLDRDCGRAIGRRFLARRIERALRLRERLFETPYYRLVHAEADGLPGLVVDRFAEVLVVQANAAGMARLEPLILDALDALLTPVAIVLRNDSPARALEGLPCETRMAKSTLAGPILVHENGAVFGADLLGGQKTGWFFDQRDNRRFVAALARGARVLDLYCYTGGFAVQAAHAGAAAVLGIDRSEPALALAAEAAAQNGVG